MKEQVWKHHFVEAFVKLLRGAKYDGEDIYEVAYQHADASWPMRDSDHEPAESAEGEFYALADSV